MSIVTNAPSSPVMVVEASYALIDSGAATAEALNTLDPGTTITRPNNAVSVTVQMAVYPESGWAGRTGAFSRPLTFNSSGELLGVGAWVSGIPN